MTQFHLDVIAKSQAWALAGTIFLGASGFAVAPVLWQGAAPIAVPQGEVKQKEPQSSRERISSVDKVSQESDAAARQAIEKLSSKDFAERDAAVEKLRDLGKDAIPALKEAAENNADMEVRWNARRVLKDLTEGQYSLKEVTKARPRIRVKALPRSGPGAEDIPHAIPETDELKLDEDLRAKVEGTLKQQMEQIHREMKELHDRIGSGSQSGRLDGPARFRIAIPDGKGQTSSFEIVNNNGQVKITVKEKNEDGEETVNTYEAPSMEEFKQKYPEVAKKYFGDGKTIVFGGKAIPGSIRLERIAPGARMEIDEDFDEDEMIDLDVDDSTGMLRFEPGVAVGGNSIDMWRIIGHDNGERLGVGVKPIGADLAKFLGIAKGTGFMVDDVQAGSMAEAMGVKVNDIVTTVDGKVVGKDATVREALAGVPAGSTLRVEIIRGTEGKKTLEAEKRAAKEVKRAER